MDITKLTDTELKALAYDQLVQIEVAQKNVQAINSELSKRVSAPKQESTPSMDY